MVFLLNVCGVMNQYKGFITAKIVKCTKDVLVIASSDSEFPSGLIEPITFSYYFTLKRIK